MMWFIDRVDAGRHLAERLRYLCGDDVVVLGLPRGGVVVAFEVARVLGAPLDVIVVRKLGVPFQPEFGFGAIGEGGVRTVDDSVVRLTGLTAPQIAVVDKHEREQLDRRVRLLRDGRPPLPLAGRTAVVVDDGIATGSTARAACRVARARGALKVVLAVPVAAADTVASLRDDADAVVCVRTPERLSAIGEWYADFSQTSDEEAAALLAKADVVPGCTATASRDVTVDAGGTLLQGSLTIPRHGIGVTGLVVFAHGSGSGRRSPRNRYVAAALNRAGLATLLTDLLTEREELNPGYVFNVGLLAARLAGITGWLHGQPATATVPVGYFGASTGAAAALWAAAAGGGLPVRAIVCRGGRPDLAGSRLSLVRAPVLLIVGSADTTVLSLNQAAQQELTCESRLAVIPGATHLFEEPGALDQVSALAAEWFAGHFTARAAAAAGPASG